MTEDQFVLGVDLGGTTLRAAVVGREGIRAGMSRPSALSAEERSDPALVLAAIARELSGGRKVSAVCVAASGPVDVVERRIHNPYTLPDWSGRDWASALSATVEAPVLFENDAVAAAIGEHRHGAGRGSSVLCMVTIGTGIGVAVVRAAGEPYRGAAAFHPEAGHLLISDVGGPCYCGVQGCWESLCSGTAIGQRWSAGPGDPETVDWDGFAAMFARGIINVERAYAPDMIVLGGGVAQSFERFAPQLQEVLSVRDPMGAGARAPIVRAELEQAGVRGAAQLAKEYLATQEGKE